MQTSASGYPLEECAPAAVAPVHGNGGGHDPVVSALLDTVQSRPSPSAEASNPGGGGGSVNGAPAASTVATTIGSANGLRQTPRMAASRGPSHEINIEANREDDTDAISASTKRKRILERERLLPPRDHLVTNAGGCHTTNCPQSPEPFGVAHGGGSDGGVAGAGSSSVSTRHGELSEGSQWGYGGQQSPTSEGPLHPRTEPCAHQAGHHDYDHVVSNEESHCEHHLSYVDDDLDPAAAGDLLARLRAVQAWADGYRRAFVPAYAPFEHTLGIVNPASGENAAAKLVLRGMRAELGSERVMVLERAVFSNPGPLRKKMREQAFLYHDPPLVLLSELAELVNEAGVERHVKGNASASPSQGMAATRATRVGSAGDSVEEVHSPVPCAATTHGGRAGGRARNAFSPVSRHRSAGQFATDMRAAFRRERGTVVISGGDGTISFTMDQVHLARREVETELRQVLRPDVPLGSGKEPQREIRSQTSNSTAGGSGDHHHPPDDGEEPQMNARAMPYAHLLDPTRYFTLPAVAPIPMGTGNDFSNCVGFGSGFTRYRMGGMCCCCERDVGQLLNTLVAAPSIPFDRWTADFIPLRAAQERLRPVPVPRSTNGGNSNSVAEDTIPAAAAAAPRGPDRPLEPNMANTVHHVDWDSLHKSGADSCKTFTITNYLGIGFDAFVTTEFAKARESYPGLCSSRMQNKALYGAIGVHGGMKCRTIRNLIPMVCVPSPWGGPATQNGSNQRAPQHQLQPSGDVHRTTLLSAGKPDMVALQLPRKAKALVMTNVSRYSSGTQPWKPKEGELYYRPVELSYREANITGLPRAPQDNNNTSSSSYSNPDGSGAGSRPSSGVPEECIISARRAVHRSPIITPVAINDSKFELQGMGGMLSYVALGLGLTGSTKMTQAGEMFIFALCTPDDLRYECGGGLSSPYSRRNMAKYEERLRTDHRVRAALNVQIDGEAIPRITEPMIVHVYPMARDRIFVRCRNPEVVRRTMPDGEQEVADGRDA